MQTIEHQILSSTLNQLKGELNDSITDPQLQGQLNITRFLLAYALNRKSETPRYSSIDEELSAIESDINAEQALLKNTINEGEQQSLNSTILAPYLQQKLNDSSVGISKVKSLLGGISKFTYIVELNNGDALVIRHDLPGGPVESNAADEFDIIKLAFDNGIAVAEPLWADHNPPFGGTCLVTRRVPGSTAYDVTGTVLGKNGADAALGLAQALAKIHAIPLDSVPLVPELANASMAEHIKHMINFFEDQWCRRRVSVSPTLSEAFKWLNENIPTGRAASLVHGDASLRNIMVHQGKVSALLDWELWHGGDHNEDLAYCRNDVQQSIGWDNFLAEYYRHGGKQYDEFAGEYFAIFAALRNAVFAENCLHSFSNPSLFPEPKLAFGALFAGRPLILDIGKRLKNLPPRSQSSQSSQRNE